jgi:hypothetical protein
MIMSLYRVVQRLLCTYTEWCRDDCLLIQGGAYDYALIQSGTEMIIYLYKVVQRWLNTYTGWCIDDYVLIQGGTEMIMYLYRVVQRWHTILDVFCTTRKRSIDIIKFYVLAKKLTFDFKFSLVVNVILLLSGDSPGPEFYASKFRNTLSVPSS